MSTVPMTIRDAKNKILADMEEAERRDAIVGETRDGDYIILTERRVFEVYQVGPTIYMQYKNVQRGGWTDIEELDILAN